jgi:uracil-DNA glycosylase
MLENVNLQQVKEKLYNRLKDSGWGDSLKSFVLSSDMDKILTRLLEEARDNKRFVPQIKDVFKAFEVCPFDKTRVVIIGQDPYPYPDVPDGIAFSCSKKNKTEVSLQLIFESIKETAVPGYQGDPDLTRWANQGVLLLNSALTTTVYKPGSHYLLWSPFIVAVLDALIWNRQDIIYVFLGKKAQEYSELVPSNTLKIMLAHPAYAAYQKEPWDCEDLWNKVNNQLVKLNQTPIEW